MFRSELVHDGHGPLIRPGLSVERRGDVKHRVYANDLGRRADVEDNAVTDALPAKQVAPDFKGDNAVPLFRNFLGPGAEQTLFSDRFNQ